MNLCDVLEFGSSRKRNCIGTVQRLVVTELCPTPVAIWQAVLTFNVLFDIMFFGILISKFKTRDIKILKFDIDIKKIHSMFKRLATATHNG